LEYGGTTSERAGHEKITSRKIRIFQVSLGEMKKFYFGRSSVTAFVNTPINRDVSAHINAPINAGASELINAYFNMNVNAGASKPISTLVDTGIN
jgi:hypothetical protein